MKLTMKPAENTKNLLRQGHTEQLSHNRNLAGIVLPL
jgi:hypothetical protein